LLQVPGRVARRVMDRTDEPECGCRLSRRHRV